MNLNGLIKQILCKIHWTRKRNKFGSLSSIEGFHWIGKIENPQYIYMGNNFSIAKNFNILIVDRDNQERYIPKLTIGDNFWSRDNLVVLCAGNITIGDNVTFAKDIFITDFNHGLSPMSENYRRNPLIIKDITIGNGVWIGERCSILPGVTIGDKAIIGAESVVTKSIPPFTIAAGNPAIVIKKFNFGTNEWEKV